MSETVATKIVAVKFPLIWGEARKAFLLDPNYAIAIARAANSSRGTSPQKG